MPLYGDAKREYDRRWIQQRRDTYFHDKFCVICGSKDDLQLDHRDPQTKISHRIWSWSEARRKAELAKCQVLCGKHHREKSREENRIRFKKPLVHGTRNAYDTYQCRCDICRKNYAAYRASLPYRQRAS